MAGQKDAWESFYADNHRPWRGVSDIKDVPFPAGGRILEIGCGNGKTALALSKKGFDVIAMDYSRSAIDMCLRSMSEAAEFVCASVLDIPFGDSSFDGVVAFHILDHLTDDEMQTAVAEIRRVMKDGSYLLVRCFTKGDMRSEKGERIDDSSFIRGNGILYHYYDESGLMEAMQQLECVSIATKEEPTRFGTVRRRIEAVFRK
ncbi:MAG: class I SAM-dependent methyltransferase [Candidatus Methanomethylophilaceae archaeon]|nr:class I SAM-dependent methyltransferase [Candidatus Methanomethylophilaceae archaeon]